MQRLQLRLANMQQWYEHLDNTSGESILFAPTDAPPPAGSSVLLDVVFVEGPRIFLKGVVIWRRSRASSSRDILPGAGVRIRSSDKDKIEYVNGFVRGGLLDKRGSGRRLPIRLQVTYSCASGRRMNFTRDLNEEGLSLNSSELLKISSPVILEVIFPAGLGVFRLSGTVVRHIDDDGGRGMGIRLLFEDEAQGNRYKETLKKVEELLLSGRLSSELLF